MEYRPNLQKKIWRLENLGCAHCAAKMEEQIRKLEGIEEATIIFETKQLRITAENPEQHLSAIKRICTTIEPDVNICDREKYEANVSSHKHHHEHIHEHNHAHTKTEGNTDLIQIVSGILFFIAGIVTRQVAFFPSLLSILLFLLAYLILGIHILITSIKNIAKGQIFDENFLMSLATIGAFVIHEYPEAVGIMLFYRIGEFFEEKAVERSRSQIMEAVDLRPEIVYLCKGDAIEKTEAKNILPGDIVLIRPGDRIPLDGCIMEGSTRLDTSPITGESVPIAVKSGESIYSGCLNLSDTIKIRVEKALEDSMVSRILNSVENAAANKPKIDRFITRFSHYYTPAVVTIALLTALLPSLFTGDWNYWVYTALSFLVMSCPCALVLSVPLAFFSGIGAGSKRGILFKGGLSMETLSQVKAVVMDKTGTITKGNFKLQKITSFTADYSEEALLALCASCEQNSSHPIAQSIVAAAKDADLELTKPYAMKELSGKGIKATFTDKTVLCGNKKLMEEFHINMNPPALTKETESTTDRSEVYLAVNGEFLASFFIADEIKSSAREAITTLKNMGLKTFMLTGDTEHTAKLVAEKTGIETVYAKLLPEEKLTILNEIRSKTGTVFFIGDGINDAPVLAGADVGAAMGNGADAAIEAADAVFMTANAVAIPESIQIAKRANAIAIQNVVFALAIKLFVMILGLVGFANMWMAVFADTGVAMLCVLNSLRALYEKK